MSRLAEFVRLPERRVFPLLAEQAMNLGGAADLLEEIVHHHPDRGFVRSDLVAREQQGDQLLAAVVRIASESFVGPLDAADVLALTKALDDPLDLIDEVADLIGLYAILEMRPQARGFTRILRAASSELAAALELLPQARDYSARTSAVVRLEREADELVRSAVADLFSGQTDPIEVIRWKDLFERLEAAVDACRRVAILLDMIALKRR